MQVFPYASMQACKYTSLHVDKYASCKYAYAIIKVSNLLFLQTCDDSCQHFVWPKGKLKGDLWVWPCSAHLVFILSEDVHPNSSPDMWCRIPLHGDNRRCGKPEDYAVIIFYNISSLYSYNQGLFIFLKKYKDL